MIPVYRPLQDLQATKTRDECLPYDLRSDGQFLRLFNWSVLLWSV